MKVAKPMDIRDNPALNAKPNPKNSWINSPAGKRYQEELNREACQAGLLEHFKKPRRTMTGRRDSNASKG